jgi:hypothetical protein
MLRYLSALLLICAAGATAWAEPVHYGLGLGLESRMQEQVNPTFYEARFVGNYSGQIRFWPMTVLIEAAYSQHESTSGAFSVTSETTTLGSWFRYEFNQPYAWSPFVTAGLGVNLDEVRSTYFDNQDVREGLRKFVGLGGGLTKTLMSHLMVEAEGRAEFIEDRKDVAYSGILRLGVLL